MKRYNSALGRLHRASERSINAFTRTEQRLQKHNAKIDVVLDEIEEQMAHLTEIHAIAKRRKADNHGVIQRIGQIVRG